MSIDRETFERADSEELDGLSVPDRVLGFLAAHEDRAFEASVIAERIDDDIGAVSTALSRLKETGLVEHKGTYWAITTDEERLAASRRYERSTALFNEQLGTEPSEEWRDAAPEYPHPDASESDGGDGE